MLLSRQGRPPVAAEDALLAEQQGDDIELGPLDRMRLSRTAAPHPAEVSIESAAVKTLIAQREILEVHNGVVNIDVGLRKTHAGNYCSS